MEKILIYAISDSIGETAQLVAKAAMSQFYKNESYEIRRFSYVFDMETLGDILDSAKSENAIVVYTLVEEDLCSEIERYCGEFNLQCVDLMTDLLKKIQARTNKKPAREPGIIRRLDEKYFKRIEAIEFAVKYDDGKDPRGVQKADIVLLGISRTSKTPLSMYLANRNIKVANIPLVPEIPVPKEVFEISKRRIIGLTNSPEKLNEIRSERLKALGLSDKANYAKLDRILQELDYAEEVMKKVGCPVINVANKAIEETAGIIVDIMMENGIEIHQDTKV